MSEEDADLLSGSVTCFFSAAHALQMHEKGVRNPCHLGSSSREKDNKVPYTMAFRTGDGREYQYARDFPDAKLVGCFALTSFVVEPNAVPFTQEL